MNAQAIRDTLFQKKVGYAVIVELPAQFSKIKPRVTVDETGENEWSIHQYYYYSKNCKTGSTAATFCLCWCACSTEDVFDLSNKKQILSCENSYDGRKNNFINKDNTYFRYDTFFHNKYILMYDSVPRELYPEFERIMNSVRVVRLTKNASSKIPSR